MQRQPPSGFDRKRAEALAAELRRTTDAEVRFDGGSRALYATDGSIYRQVPIGVVVPRSIDDVVATIAACRRHDAPLLARGGGTSLAGQCCNVAVVVDFSKYLHRVLSIDPGARRARVQPGCVLDVLRDAAEAHALTFGPDPSTHAHNTLGGMIGNDSCGVHSVMSGRTVDNVRSLDIVTYDGVRMTVGPTSDDEYRRIQREGGRRAEIYRALRDLRDRYADEIRRRYPQIPRRVSGFNLDELLPERGFNVARALVGSEGSCVTVLGAELDLVDSPRARSLLVLGYEDVFHAADHVPQILEHGPIGLEGMDHLLIDFMQRKHLHPKNRALLPDGGGWLLVEFGGRDKADSDQRARALMTALRDADDTPSMKLFDDPDEEKLLWKVREAGLGATAFVPGEHNTHPGWEDAAVPPARVGAYLREFRQLLSRYDYKAALYGHFGDGCIHCRIDFELATEPGLAKWRAFMNDAADLVVRHGGSLSGEHGDGQVRASLLPKMYGDELMAAFRAFKAIWDPQHRMNPGKKIEPYPMDANLRRGPDFRPPLLRTQFAYPDDAQSFNHAVGRCVGVGNCRNEHGGVMCPSYRGTREERYSTRGRAHLLFEMTKHGPIDDGFSSDAVHDALDLCLACKGCKQDCPVDVDMATYKAEFMAHHYRRRLRPRSAYSMGLIWWWSRLATHLPRLANFILQAPGLGRLAKRIGGIAVQRAMPRYATQSFVQWFRSRRATPLPAGAREVLLWPDTWNNFFHPAPLQAAVRVLEAAGCRVRIPDVPLCCQRPLYAEGMLDLARRELGRVLDALAVDLARGVTVVGLEPSCIASFRDELPRLFPADERARRLAAQSLLLSEFLDGIGWEPPPFTHSLVVQAHCHHHASLDVDAERRLLERLGGRINWLDGGCCGMAGSFGFRASTYALSQTIGEHAVLPAVRAASHDTIVLANGFSCREQISQGTGRQALTLAEILDMALPPYLAN
ncbi:FAD-binding protein [Solimonas sp. C16B3]|uniref:FAD-binding protein n=2 Tax=Solimonas marina TaxID=2714601 RepID=A0A969WGS9_9GAMM|nr:FAD-binding protein [Solimonas marina]